MKIKLILILLVLTNFNLLAQCPTVNLTLTTQTSVNNFVTNYPSCTNLNVNLTISGTNITNLNGLSSLLSVSGDLVVSNCPNLTDISGLNNITTITGYFKIVNNDLLTTLPSFQNLTSLNNLMIRTCDVLNTINSFNYLTSVNRIEISSNINITTISGFSNLLSVSELDVNSQSLANIQGISNLNTIGSLSLRNTQLPNLNNLGNVQSINSLGISFNSQFLSFEGLNPLITINSIYLDNNPLFNNFLNLSSLTNLVSLTVRNCNSLTNFNGLNLTSLNSLNLYNNPQLNSLSAFNTITSLSDGFYVINCSNLQNLIGLQNLVSSGRISIGFNSSLVSLNGLNNLTVVNGNLDIYNNNNLGNLSGLESLASVGCSLQIYNNPILSNLNGLINLQNVFFLGAAICDGQGTVLIENNPLLSSLQGLNNINFANIDNLTITNCPQLSICSVSSICNYLSNGGLSTIIANSTNCNSSSQILNNCSLSVSEIENFNLIIYPNPTNSFIDISTITENCGSLKLDVFDNLGKQLKTNIINSKIDFSQFQNGIYYIKFECENQIITKKIIKQ